MTLPLYKANANHTSSMPNSANRGLWFGRFFNEYNLDWSVGDNAKKNWINTVCGTDCGEINSLNAFSLRTERLATSLNAEINDGFYLWNDLSTKPTYTINQPGLYWVEVGNHCGTDIDSIEVTFVDCYCYIYVPNAFSPNGDGTNDYFSPVSNCGFVEYRLQIFNRWGDLVYERTNFPIGDNSAGWDGTLNGKMLNAGVFVFFLEVEFIDGSVEVFSGDVVLVR